MVIVSSGLVIVSDRDTAALPAKSGFDDGKSSARLGFDARATQKPLPLGYIIKKDFRVRASAVKTSSSSLGSVLYHDGSCVGVLANRFDR